MQGLAASATAYVYFNGLFPAEPGYLVPNWLSSSNCFGTEPLGMDDIGFYRPALFSVIHPAV